MKQLISGCEVGHWKWGRGGAQRSSVRVMLLRGCGGEKHNRAGTYRETLRCVRVSMVTWRSIILHNLNVCVCVRARVALGIRHAKLMRCIMYPLVVCLLRTNTFCLFRKGTIFWKKLMNTKCILVFPRIYAVKFLIVSRINRNITITVVSFSCKGKKLFLSDFNETWASSTGSRKVAGSVPDGFMEIYIALILRATLWPWSRHNLRERSTSDISWGGLRRPFCSVETWTLSCVDCHEISEPQHSGNVRDSSGLYRDFLLYLRMGRAVERDTTDSVAVVWELWGGNWKWKNDGMGRG